MTARPRIRPCSSCPYRRDVPSGVWSGQEYRRLGDYDGDTGEQGRKGAFGVFACHQGDGQVCAGWAHIHGNEDSLALRLARYADPPVDVAAVLAYRTVVPLWESGAEAAAHGLSELENPGVAAREACAKITAVRALRGEPVTYADGGE
jgi:hypothetical protein